MRLVTSGPALVTLAAALAACTAQTDGPGVASASNDSVPPVPGGIYREGGSIASMAEQYARPRPGLVPAAGASAWVAPAPAPAFVATGPMPPAAPEPPSPLEVAIEQPRTPAASAAEVVRPEAGGPELAAAAADARSAALRSAGLELFNDFSCGACHAFADAGASGGVGPSLDGNRSKALLVDVITNGRGAMPGFGGQMSDAEIETLADYLFAFARK